MRFVYQTKLDGKIDLPHVKSYTRFCLIISTLTKGKNLLKGDFIESEFGDMLQAIKSLGAKLYKRDNGIVVEAPNDNILPFETLFKEEIAILKENYGDDVFTKDTIIVNENESVSKIFCLILGNIIYEHACALILPRDINSYKDLNISMAALEAFGGNIEVNNQNEIIINNSPLVYDLEIDPGTDMRIGSFAVICSCLFPELKLTNYYQESSISGYYDLILPLSELGFKMATNEDGESFIEKNEISESIKIDCEKAGSFLPYLLFISTCINKTTEFFNCTPECALRDNNCLYYTISELHKLGADIKPMINNSFSVTGGKRFSGGANLDCHENLTNFFINILGTLYSDKANSIENFDCLNKYVGFWDLFTGIGGFTEEI